MIKYIIGGILGVFACIAAWFLGCTIGEAISSFLGPLWSISTVLVAIGGLIGFMYWWETEGKHK